MSSLIAHEMQNKSSLKSQILEEIISWLIIMSHVFTEDTH